MSSPSSAAGRQFAKYAYDPSKNRGDGGSTSNASTASGGRENLGRKKFRRIVKNLDDEDGDNCVGDYDLVSSPSNVKMRHRAGSSSSNSTSTPTGRSTPKKSQRSEGHEGTRDSSVAAGSRKSENAGARVGRSRRGDEADSDGGTSSGEDNAWFKKPSKGSGTTVSSLGGKRPGDTSSIKVKRAEAMANPGWIQKSDPSNAAQRQKNAQRAKAQRRLVSSQKGGKSTTRRRLETEDESEADEGEFESDDESSGSEDELQLTDASEGDDDSSTKKRRMEKPSGSKQARGGSGSSSASSTLRESGNRATSGEFARKGTGVPSQHSSSSGEKRNGLQGSAPPIATARNSSTHNGVKHPKLERGNVAGNRVLARGVNTSPSGSGTRDDRESGGKSARLVKHSRVANHEAKAEREQGRKAKDGGTRRSGSEADLKASRADESEQEIGSKGKRQQMEGEEAPKKKKKVVHVREEDELDLSDHGSDSDDDGAKARRVLEECSALSKKLASVISSWAASKGEGCLGKVGDAASRGVGSPRGAIEITQMREGKSVTTNEEISRACPGLKLNPYQLVGVNWMCLLRETGVNGVLADEMGLGKTVQTIAFFALLRHRRKGTPPRRPHLIVVPSSVLDNWDSELKKFCPSLEVVKYHGSMRDRSSIRQRLGQVADGRDRDRMPDIMLTTYVIWERETCGDDRTFLKRFKYDYMVLDEGHSIKNIKSSRFQRLRIVGSKHRLLLSGTPVQNNLGELLALLSFLMPAIFRSDVIETLLEFLGNGESLPPSQRSSASSFQVQEVRGMLAPFVLRRLKAGVLKQLVAKTERLEMVPLSKVQRSLYKGVLEEHVRQKRAAIERALALEAAPNRADGDGTATNVTRSSVSKRNGVAKGSVGLEDGDEGAFEAVEISAKEIKNVFTELRKSANHPLMLLNYFKGGKLEEVVKVLHETGYFGGQATKEMVAREVSTYSDFDVHQVCSTIPSLNHLRLPEESLFTSAKMERLRTLLPELISKGHRVLLFSQWTRLLDLLEVLLQEAMGLKFCRLDGSTPVSERKALIDRFGADRSISVFLLSTRAGGLGINLTSADTVILHDVDFNPENDRQAEDRCHRIGQTKPVTVIKMVAEGTVDEDIYTMGERKKKVNKSVLDDTASKEADTASTISGILKRALQAHLSSSSR